ncbi:MAG: heavy-metal-associated domain-containing protein [Sulfuricurvum sp.]|jgi:copper chaperone CopZ
MKSFSVANVKCGGCANTIKSALKDEFGEVEIDLSVEPRVISLEIADEDVEKLRSKMLSLGYPFVDEDLNLLQKGTTKAKSFVSCAIGKMGE